MKRRFILATVASCIGFVTFVGSAGAAPNPGHHSETRASRTHASRQHRCKRLFPYEKGADFVRCGAGAVDVPPPAGE